MNILKTLFLFVVLLANFSLANELVEDRLENKIEFKLSKILPYKLDIDVDIHKSLMNIEVEIEEKLQKNLDYNFLCEQILSYLDDDIKNLDIYIVFKEDFFDKERILFSKTFKK